MSIRTLTAIKEAEEHSVSIVEEAQKEADRLVKENRENEKQKQQKRLEEALLKKEEILNHAKTSANVQCSKMESDNLAILEQFENPSKDRVQEAVNLVVKQVLMYGS
jgi:vacuolar-type H+-ATPase subunit H